MVLQKNEEDDTKDDSADSDEQPSKLRNVPVSLKKSPSADLETVIPEHVPNLEEPEEDLEEPEEVSVKEPAVEQTVAATKQQTAVAPKLISFLNSCGIEDEDVYEAFVAFGVQTEEDLSELAEDVGYPGTACHDFMLFGARGPSFVLPIPCMLVRTRISWSWG
jgi:hypothetical protein